MELKDIGGEPLDGSGFENEEPVTITTDDGTVLENGKLVILRGQTVTSAPELPLREDPSAR